MREALVAHGYDPDCTPVDKLMAAPLAVHFAVVEAMKGGDDAPKCRTCGHDMEGDEELELCRNCFEWTYNEPYPET